MITAGPQRTENFTAGRSSTLASYAFALVGWELVVVAVTALVGLRADRWSGVAVHQVLTVAGWVTGTVVLARAGHPALTARGRRGHRLLRTGLVVALAVVVIAVRWWAVGGGQASIVGEHRSYVEDFGQVGWVSTLGQIGYYVAEAGVVTLLIAFGQRAGESWTARPAVPWGGLAAAVSWGAVHVLLQGGAAGLYAMAVAVAMGVVHVLLRSWRATWGVAAVVFVV
ncbi:hypothetical protein AB2L27_09865 [Kineococcus sp. LSe6-4]|uniref:CPBP family intramembrane metalloprotease n=1 Tax=Kineococcus halophytocola TaxID=3234027 RepID=A0ABV4H176_9ACTN